MSSDSASALGVLDAVTVSKNLKLSVPAPSYPFGIIPDCHPSLQVLILVFVSAILGVFTKSENKKATLVAATPGLPLTTH